LNEIERIHFTIKILFFGFDGVQIVTSFKVLNDLTLNIILNL